VFINVNNVSSESEFQNQVIDLLNQIINNQKNEYNVSEENQLLNSKQVMDYLQISEKTLIGIERSRKIIPKRVGNNKKRYLMKDIQKYLNSK